uniref:Uncharacterized protein n=1 Tax=Strongyloides venezuelensis TaxID=75913 RepID=A0A0K0FNY3_STRVS
MKFRKNFSILLFFVILSVFWKLCEFQPMYGGPYGRYGRFGGYGRHRFRGPHRPPPPPHRLGMRPPPPFMHHPVGIQRYGPHMQPPFMGPRGPRLYGGYR